MRYGVPDLLERDATFKRIMKEPVFLGSNQHLLLASQRKPSDLRLLDIGQAC
jgi:hypothetical protein